MIEISNVYSLVLYLLVFSIAILAYYFSAQKKNTRVLSFTLLAISILLLSLFSGLRVDVGTDYTNYYNSIFYLSDVSLFDQLKSGNFEIGFYFLKFIAYNINYPPFLFI